MICKSPDLSIFFELISTQVSPQFGTGTHATVSSWTAAWADSNSTHHAQKTYNSTMVETQIDPTTSRIEETTKGNLYRLSRKYKGICIDLVDWNSKKGSNVNLYQLNTMEKEVVFSFSIVGNSNWVQQLTYICFSINMN